MAFVCCYNYFMNSPRLKGSFRGFLFLVLNNEGRVMGYQEY